MKSAKSIRGLCLSLALAAAALLAAVPAQAAGPPAPAWLPLAASGPTNLPPSGEGEIAIFVQNIGGVESSGTITVTDKLPAGLITAGPVAGDGWSCPAASGLSEFTCTSSQPVGPGVLIGGPQLASDTALMVPVDVLTATEETLINEVSVSGGGAASPATYEQEVTISSTPAKPGIEAFSAASYDADGSPSTQAASHPYIGAAAALFNTIVSPTGRIVPAGAPKTAAADLPPGFLANPIATPRCPEGREDSECPIDTQVGTIHAAVGVFGQIFEPEGVHAVEAPVGYPAKYTFEPVGGLQLAVIGGVRSDGDFGLTVESPNTPQIKPVYGYFFTFWGSPADSAHDNQRCVTIGNQSGCAPSTAGEIAFLTLGSGCAFEAEHPPLVGVKFDSWLDPGNFETGTFPVPPVTGCDQLELEADFTFQPAQKAAASPSAFTVDLNLPQEGLTDPTKLATPPLRKTIVTLPKGVSVNPATADGIATCSPEQIGLKGTNFGAPNPIRFTKESPRCPDASKIGTIEVDTALLDDPLPGTLYLAAQGDNPFGSTFAIYLVVDDPSVGVVIKLPGRVEPDPATGQLSTTFDNLPQLAFGNLRLDFKGGDRAPLTTPETCGTAITSGQFTPWSAPESGADLFTADSFTIDSGPNGAPCASSLAARPFNLGFSAGTTNPVGGAHSSFTMRLTRPDGAQEIDRLELKTPEGFSAVLKGIPYCSDAQIDAAKAKKGRAEQQSPSCPSASQIGNVTVGAGVGRPFFAPGKVYLAGPYKGSSLSLVTIVPAVAGPYDLGAQVVRVALQVDPTTAQITAKTDPLPKLLEGVPLRIRDIRVSIDKPNFAINPTDCNASEVLAKVSGDSGAIANLSNRFQVGGCENLGFKPNLSVHLKGGTKRGDHPGLKATLKARPGDANIAGAVVTLPRSAFLDQAHIRTVCTRVQFAASQCPPGSIYGHAVATSPLIDDPLSGNVYLRSSDNLLPDLVVDLNGQVRVTLAGRVDSVKGGLRNSFEVVPDAAVDTFTLTMQGGKKGLVVNSTNLCLKPNRAKVKLSAQNGKRFVAHPKVVPDNCKKVGRKGKRGRGR